MIKTNTTDVIEIRTFNDYAKARRAIEDFGRQLKGMQNMAERRRANNESASPIIKEIDRIKKNIEAQRSNIDSFRRNQSEYDIAVFKKNLELYLRGLEIRISDLEDYLGLSAGYISRATNNVDSKRRLSIDVVWQICLILNVNMDDFLNRDMSLPTKALTEVLDFLAKLKSITDETGVHWTNHGQGMDDISKWFLKKTEGIDETKYMYAPRNYESTTRGKIITGDVYSANIEIGEVYLIPLATASAEYGYEVYVLVEEDYGQQQYLELIFATWDDRSGTLKIKCDELVNVIKEHEADFVVSNGAKSIISRFLNDGKIVNIEDELPFN